MRYIVLIVGFLFAALILFFVRQKESVPKEEVVQWVVYTKSCENADAGDVLSNKTNRFDKLFFNDRLFESEYLIQPSFETPRGLRVIKDASGRLSTIEVLKIGNWDDVNSQLYREFESVIDANLDTPELDSIYNKMSDEGVKRYQVDRYSIPVGDALADELYRQTVAALDSARAELTSDQVIRDGTTALFRYKSDSLFCTLNYHAPEGVYQELSGIVSAIIDDIFKTQSVDESKYIELLSELNTTDSSPGNQH